MRSAIPAVARAVRPRVNNIGSAFACIRRWDECRGKGMRFSFGETKIPFSTEGHSLAKRNEDDSRKLEGEQCYKRALAAFEAAEQERQRKEKERSTEQFEAWKRAQERSKQGKSSAHEGVAVVRTIAKQVRLDRASDDSVEHGLKDEAQSMLEKAAFEYSHPEALVRLGNSSLEKAKTSSGAQDVLKHVQRAITLYESAGHAGSATGWFNLGHLRWTGYSLEDDNADTSSVLGIDRKGAMDAFQSAIDLGDADAMYFVGVQAFSDEEGINAGSLHSGVALIEKAAGFGHGGALHYLALLHYNGNDALGVQPCSPPQFVQRLDAAAEAGDADALFMKGHCLYNGDDGYLQNYSGAFAAFLSAAEAGNSDAAVSAGAMLHQGIGVKQDQQRAFELYQTAGELGNLEGWRNVVACYALGEGVPQCENTAKYIHKTMLKQDVSRPSSS